MYVSTRKDIKRLGIRKGLSVSPGVDHLTFKCLNLSSVLALIENTGCCFQLIDFFSFLFFIWKSIKNFPASHHIGHRQHSPGGQGVRNSSLRVVIPGSMNNSGLQTNDEITYNEVHKNRFFHFQFSFILDTRLFSHINSS